MTTHSFTSIYGEHQEMKRAIHLAKQFTKHAQPVLITGDIGTGKTRFAHEIAHASAPNASLTHLYCPILDEDTLQKSLHGKDPSNPLFRRNRRIKYSYAASGCSFSRNLSCNKNHCHFVFINRGIKGFIYLFT
ncbi:sigma 54-interacting transcriptional regulator [Bacillus pumilus]|uniref:sigma 54-interacting transcriptional regulator n=1 Tax=Bacillus pumilus TaxID=1408 RepID=UPI0024059E89|nr:sigma 54-interacting transcriptional regulator [Bacillus pumilus]MDF9785196.1 transcriptional regulator of aromatic amino acid metabolism [Bacillus pumilus]